MLIEFRPFRANSIKIQRGQERNQTMAKVRPIVEALEKHSHNQQRNSGQPLCADQPDEPLVGRPDGHLLQLRYANIWKSKSVPRHNSPESSQRSPALHFDLPQNGIKLLENCYSTKDPFQTLPVISFYVSITFNSFLNSVYLSQTELWNSSFDREKLVRLIHLQHNEF